MSAVDTIPENFKYLDVFLKGRPQHAPLDDFSIRHPKMPCGKRAKIFAPFDALRGFHFAIMTKQVLYEQRPALSLSEEQELNRCLTLLHALTENSRKAQQNQLLLSVTYFVPCNDPQHEAFGTGGLLRSVTGVCKAVDCDVSRSLQIESLAISFADIVQIKIRRTHAACKAGLA